MTSTLVEDLVLDQVLAESLDMKEVAGKVLCSTAEAPKVTLDQGREWLEKGIWDSRPAGLLSAKESSQTRDPWMLGKPRLTAETGIHIFQSGSALLLSVWRRGIRATRKRPGGRESRNHLGFDASKVD